MSTHGGNKKNGHRDKKEMNQNIIKEVYIDNFEEELKKISLLIDRYSYISMDTEFPGIVYNNYKSINIGESSSYSNIKSNVDRLKVIQVGITLADENGEYPSDISTWQFNFDFNLKNDNYSPESIQLLMNSGINFDILPEKGISVFKFGEMLLTSGLVINDNINWITFHGSYDFAYLLKIITGQMLPDSVESFVFDIDVFFKNYYDIRYLTQNQECFRGSLNKLAYDLNCERTGLTHQAGSDSLVTSKVFFKLKELCYLNDEDIAKGKNQIYCLNSEKEDSYFDTNSMNNQNVYNNGYGMNSLNISNMGLNNNMINNANLGYPSYDNNYIYGINNTNYHYFNNNNLSSKEKSKNLMTNSGSVNTVGNITKKSQKR